MKIYRKKSFWVLIFLIFTIPSILFLTTQDYSTQNIIEYNITLKFYSFDKEGKKYLSSTNQMKFSNFINKYLATDQDESTKDIKEELLKFHRNNSLEVIISNDLLKVNAFVILLLIPLALGFGFFSLANFAVLLLEKKPKKLDSGNLLEAEKNYSDVFSNLNNLGLHRRHKDNRDWAYYIEIIETITRGLFPYSEDGNSSPLLILLSFPGNRTKFLDFIENEENKYALELFKLLDGLIRIKPGNFIVGRIFVCPTKEYEKDPRANEYADYEVTIQGKNTNHQVKLFKNTAPINIDSNDPDLRKRYSHNVGDFEFVIVAATDRKFCISFVEDYLTFVLLKEYDHWQSHHLSIYNKALKQLENNTVSSLKNNQQVSS